MWLVIRDSDNLVLFIVNAESFADTLVLANPGTRKQSNTDTNIRRGDYMTPEGVRSQNIILKTPSVDNLIVQAQNIYRRANPAERWSDKTAIVATSNWLHHQAGGVVRCLASSYLDYDAKAVAVQTYSQVTEGLVAVWYNVMTRNRSSLRLQWSSALTNSGFNLYSDIFGADGAARPINGAFDEFTIDGIDVKMPWGEVDSNGVSQEFNPEDMAGAVANPVNNTADGSP